MNDNEKSAKEYRESAEQHLAAVKFSIGSFLIVGLFVVAGLVIAVAFSLSWFANNRLVNADDMKTSVRDEQIELRSYGTSGVHDDVLKKLLGESGEKGFWYSLPDSKVLDTSRLMPTVNWLLLDDSNIGNFSNEGDVDWSDPDNRRTDYAIEPGASGDITFYIVPKVSGDITVKCSLGMVPYYIENGEFYAIEEDSFVPVQLGGHILFFLYEQESDGAVSQDKKTIQWIKDGEFEVQIENAVIDQEYKYTLHWSWPQTFGEIILPDGDAYLNGRVPVYSEYANCEDLRTAIVEEMETNPQRFFYSSLTKKPLDNEYTEIKFMSEIHEKTTDQLMQESAAETIQAFVDLSSYYNQADQYIGKNVDCVRVSLVAELYGGEN